LSENAINGPEVTVPLGSRKDVPCGKYMHLDISAHAQVKNCKLTGVDKADKTAIAEAAEAWFTAKGKGALQFDGKPFGEFVMEKPQVNKEGFDVKLKASFKYGELVFDLKFVDLTNGKPGIPAPDTGKWPHFQLTETVKNVHVTADVFPVIQAVGHPQYKEILMEAGIETMKTKLGQKAAQALAKTAARYGLSSLATDLEAAAAAGAEEAGAAGAAVVLTPVVGAAAAVAAVILSGAWAWKYHSDTEKIVAAKGEVGHLASRLWYGFQMGVLGHSAPSDEGKEAFPLGVRARQHMLAEIQKQHKNAPQHVVDDAIKHASDKIFNDGRYHAALVEKARSEVWEDCKTNLAPYWLSAQPNRLKQAYINIYGSDSGYDAAVKGIQPKKG